MHSEWPKLHIVLAILAVLRAIGLNHTKSKQWSLCNAAAESSRIETERSKFLNIEMAAVQARIVGNFECRNMRKLH